MKPQHFGAFFALAGLLGAPATQSADTKAGSFVQVSIHGTAHGNAAINDIAIASLPGDSLTKLEVDGDGVTFTHYCR